MPRTGSKTSLRQGTLLLDTLIVEASLMSDPTISPDTTNAISSLASGSGRMLYAAPGDLTPTAAGQAHAHANLSPRQAKELGLLTSGTYGRHGSGSSNSVALNESLVSRLRRKTAWAGSTLFNLTWTARVTPEGRSISALRASVRRISANACGSWPTPNSTMTEAKSEPPILGTRKETDPQIGLADVAVHLASWPTPNAEHQNDKDTKWEARREAVRKRRNNGNGFGLNLSMAASMVGWPTPKAHDGEFGTPMTSGRPMEKSTHLATITKLTGWVTPTATDSARGGKDSRAWDTGMPLTQQAALAGWLSPTSTQLTRSEEGVEKRKAFRESIGRKSQAPGTLEEQALLYATGPARLTVSGDLLTGSDAGMESGGQLNPGHSRWLMGIPTAWDDSAPMATRSTRKSRQPSSKSPQD